MSKSPDREALGSRVADLPVLGLLRSAGQVLYSRLNHGGARIATRLGGPALWSVLQALASPEKVRA